MTEWVSVEERLPDAECERDHDDQLLVDICREGKYVHEAVYCQDVTGFFGHGIVYPDVTHWIEKRKPPESAK